LSSARVNAACCFQKLAHDVRLSPQVAKVITLSDFEARRKRR
jgi:hypothetical protein